MDTLTTYRHAIKKVLQEFVDYVSGSPSHQTDLFVVSDEQKDTYTVFNLGWEGQRRILSMPVLMRLVNGKIWVEADNTDYVFVDRLLEVGVPKTGIVLAFHAPHLRPYTEFAVD